MSKSTQQKSNPFAVLVDITIDRYEDTGKGYMTAGQAMESCRTHLQSLLDAPATDKRPDGTIDKSIAAMVSSIGIDDVKVQDNGPDSDGDDEGRWTVSFKLLAAFTLYASSRHEAEAKVMADIDAAMEDVMDGSIEEYACNMSCDIA